MIDVQWERLEADRPAVSERTQSSNSRSWTQAATPRAAGPRRDGYGVR